MSFFKSKKRRLSLTRILLTSFGVMVAFSIYLHDHEFDPFTTDEDCAPCQWSQISVNLTSDISSLDFIPIIFTNEAEIGVLHYKNFKHSYFGLSPPVFS